MAAAVAAVLCPWDGAAAQGARERPVALVAELDGIVHPIAAEYVADVLDEAGRVEPAVVVLVLRTPGGLLDSTRTIVSRLIASRTPVVVWVGPSGARAASAGFIIAIAADVVAMAPGTHIGAAHPVSADGETVDETAASKAAADTAAYARTLAQTRGRNVELSEAAVLESRAFTDREALEAMPPLIDVVAADIDTLLREIDGRTVRRFDGSTTTLRTAGAETRPVEMTWRQRFLSAIAHPQVAYLLLTLGMLGLVVELWNPGAVAPGVAGGLALLLAFFAFQIVPVDVAGLLLIVFGLGLIVLELNVPSFGVLGIGGTVALVFGSIMATREVPGVRVSLAAILPAALLLAAGVFVLGRLALKAQRQPPETGAEGMIGVVGRSRTSLGPDTPGQIDAHGEIWRAVSRQPLAAGARVRVIAMDGLTTVVEPAPDGLTAGDDGWRT
jgi:membrane-bound serine protease (ClpP class)